MDSEDHPEGLRQRKRRETRAALSHAAIRLCIRHGWENVNVDDIAAAANVSPRTFRNYFSTKAEAVAAGHLERMLRIADELRVRPAGESLWTAINLAVATQFQSAAPAAAKFPDARRRLELIRFFGSEPAIQGEILKATAVAQAELARSIAVRLGAAREELYPQVMASVVSAVIGVVMDRWMRDAPSCSIIPRLQEAFALVEAGLPQSGAGMPARSPRPKSSRLGQKR
jgi:AcrR family transcriptional regulator